MKLKLFNKNSNGSDELKKVLGNIYASVSFDEFEPFLVNAEQDLKRLLTTSIFALASDHYASDNYNNSNQGQTDYTLLDDFVYKCQSCIARYGYHKYAPSADLARSNSGRKFAVDPNLERIPSDKMLKRDDEINLQMAHEAADRIFEFLEENKLDALFKTVLLASDLYKTRSGLFITTIQEFEGVFPIFGSYRTFQVLVPFIRETQNVEIQNLLGVTKYDAAIADLKAAAQNDPAVSGVPSAETLKIKELATIAMVFGSLKKAAERLSVQILPQGIFRNVLTDEATDNEKRPVEDSFYSKVVRNMDKQFINALKSLEEYMLKQADGTDYEIITPADRIDPTEKFARI
jgi:hypothetical protein